MPFNRSRSFSSVMRRDTAMWSIVGMRTTYRPGMLDGGDPRPFRPDGAFGHLDDDFVTFFEHVLDGLDPPAADAAVGPVVVLQRIVHVQKRVPVQADVDKGRLHAGQHVLDAAFVNISHYQLVVFPL